MFDASRLVVGGAALALASAAMLACAPHADFEDAEAAESGVFAALTEASERAHAGEPRAALGQLIAAAEHSEAEAFTCEIGMVASEVADELLELGAYSEARMGYALAKYHARACDEQLPEHARVESLALRQRDARETHQWAESPVTALD